MCVCRQVQMDSAGGYVCKASNELGDGQAASFSLTVNQKPRIVSGLQNTILRKAGDTGLVMTCSGVGKPEPSVSWFKNGVLIDPTAAAASRYTVSSSAQVNSPPQATTHVVSTIRFAGPGRNGTAVLATDTGEYVCQFENSVGRAQSAVALKVEHHPLVAHRATKIAAEPGQVVHIPCRMKAFPAPTFEWEWQKTAARSRLGLYEVICFWIFKQTSSIIILYYV